MINSNKKVLLSVIALLNVFSPILEAASADSTPVPLTIEADRLHLNDSTGEVYAKGNAVITKENDKLLSEYIRGNTKENMLWVDDEVTFLHDALTLIGKKLVYNYKEKTGSLEQTKTSVKREGIPEGYFHHEVTPLIVTGGHTEFSKDKATVYNASATSCTLSNPDYRITTDKIEIWAGDKMVASNVKLYIKNTPIITLPKHKISLTGEGSSKSIFPRIKYDSKDGITLAQYLEYPVAEKTSLFADLVYYSKKDFKPTYGLTHKENGYAITIQEFNAKNGDDEWIEKKNDFVLQLTPKRLGNLPLTANVSAEIGDWQEDNITGQRKSYNFYLSADPIKIANHVSLNLGTGYEKIHYNYDDTDNSIKRFDVRIDAEPTDKLKLWTGYSYAQQTNTSPYQYDRIDNPRELTTGFMYRIAKKDGFGISTIYDLQASKLEDVDYTWKHDLHCWETSLTYRAKRNEWRFDIANFAW